MPGMTFATIIFYFTDSPSSLILSRPHQLIFTFSRDVTGPLYVYYELQNFYQNHRLYVASRSAEQLLGQSISESVLTAPCQGALKNGSRLLNPCGLIAASYFTGAFLANLCLAPIAHSSHSYSSYPHTRIDLITLVSSSSPGAYLNEYDISWPTDREDKFKQVDGYMQAQVSGANASCPEGWPTCKLYYDSSSAAWYAFYYPNEDSVQYLYESYPGIVSPLLGVTDEHFIVWMHTAGTPQFRKLYGRIDGDWTQGQQITFGVTANYEVGSFDGSKAIILSQEGLFGGRNFYLGTSYITVGSLCFFFAALFTLKYVVQPRSQADPSLLAWER
jgi:hypothetical protein